MDFLISTIVSGFMWDVMKSATKSITEKLFEQLSYTTDYKTCQKIAEKVNELGVECKSYSSYETLVKNDKIFVSYINSNICYKTNFAKRMDFFISISNRYLHSNINLEIIAEYLKYSSVNELKKFYLESEEPSFEFITHVANALGISKLWLKSGTGVPFTATYKSDFAMDCYEQSMNDNPETIIFCLSEESHMGLVFKRDKIKYSFCEQTWHFNNEVGGGGIMRICSIYYFIKKLSDDEKLTKCSVRYFNNNDFASIFHGEIPTSSVESLGESKFQSLAWLKDFIDLNSNSRYGNSFKFCCQVVTEELNN